MEMQDLGQASQLAVTKVASNSGYLAAFDPVLGQVQWYTIKADTHQAQLIKEWTLNIKSSPQKQPPIKQVVFHVVFLGILLYGLFGYFVILVLIVKRADAESRESTMSFE